MSFKLVGEVFSAPLPPLKKLVLLALAEISNDHGDNIYPSIRTIAIKASISERHTQRLMKEMIGENFISVVKNEKGGAGLSKHYLLHIDVIRAVKKDDTVSSFPKGCQATPEKGDSAMAEKDDNGVTQTVKNHKANQLAKTVPERKGDKASSLPSLDIVSDAEVARAKRGERGYEPQAHASEILPGGWYDLAIKAGLPESNNAELIYKSWRRFKQFAAPPYTVKRWRGWLANEGRFSSTNQESEP